MTARLHACGRPMTATFFGYRDPTPRFRGQPVWACDPCGRWEPHEDWDGLLPDGWNGHTWTTPHAGAEGMA